MVTPFEVSHDYVERLARLNPHDATTFGIPGYDHLWPDLSPSGRAEVADLHRAACEAMKGHFDHPDPHQALAARVVHGYAEAQYENHQQGDDERCLAHINAPFEMFRDSFDLMDIDTPTGIENVITRLETVGPAYEGYRRALTAGIAHGNVVAGRQVHSVTRQIQALAGDGSAYDALRARMARMSRDQSERYDRAAVFAKAQAADFGRWLETDYLPHARTEDAVGEERYLRNARQFLGLEIEPHEVYAWGWSEIGALLDELARVGAEIQPDASLPELVELLETDPERSAPSHRAFVDFVAQRLDDALVALDGTHFDVPAEIRSITVNLAPPGSPPGAYYVDPSEDFSRPGSVWYSVGSKETVPLYQQVSTAYHEGFPGHHLEIGLARVNADRLSRAQRSFIWYSGFGEGWALYAERLMDELGYFERPEYRFGMLASQLFRAARVVTDIGLHLRLEIPAGAPLGAGEVWHRDLAVEFIREVGMQPPDEAASEVDRYLGWPGQAISYKVGEREILAIRDAVRVRQGDTFELRSFHSDLLAGGNMPLGLLRRRLVDHR